MDSFVWRALLSMALLTLSAMIYACCNRSAPTTGESTPRSYFLQPDEPMMCTNLSLEGIQKYKQLYNIGIIRLS